MGKIFKAKWLVVLLTVVLLSGCSSGDSILDQLTIEPDEYGFVRVEARVDVNNNPFATTWADIIYCEYGEKWPEDVPRPTC